MLTLAFCISLHSQRPGGQDDQTGQGLEFATISLFNKRDSSLVSGALTEANGFFTLKTKPGRLYMVVDYISYSSKTVEEIPFERGVPVLDLGQIKIAPSSTLLEDIEIVGERSETSFSLDKKVFTVGKDLANRGGTAEDVLDNVPSVTVDIEGAVSLRGSEGVRILIDGRPSGLAGVGNTNGLRNIPSNLIEKVEVITNPSARYEAEGSAGIINIVLKKQKGNGFNGSFDVTVGYPYRLGTAANLNYRKGKVNFFINYGINDRENPGGGNRIQDQLVRSSFGESSRLLSIQDRDQNRMGLSNSFRGGIDYFLSEKEQLTGSFVYRVSDENNLTEINYIDYAGNQLSGVTNLWDRSLDELNDLEFDAFEENLSGIQAEESLLRTDNELEDERNQEYRINYRKEYSSRDHFLNASVQFRDKSETESSNYNQTSIINSGSPDLFQRSENAEGEKTMLAQVDYSHAYSKDHKWELGLRSSIRDIENDFIVEESNNGNNWFELDQWTNDFLYNENIHAAYGIYGNTHNKISYQVGLRSEYSLINTRLLKSENGGENKRSYTNLFPSGHLNYNFSEKTALQVSYSRRVRRPRFRDLNPFFTFSDNRNFFSGNPNLDPQFTDSYELGNIQYWENVSLSSSLFYRTTDQSMNRILTLEKSAINTLRMPVNIGTTKDLGLDVSMSYSGIKWLRLDGNVNIFNNKLILDENEVESAVYDVFRAARDFEGSISDFRDIYTVSVSEVDNVTWNGRLTSRITFWESDLQLRFNYRGPRDSAQGFREGIGSLDIGWSKDLLAKKMTMTLSVRDLFNSRKRQGITYFDDFVDKSEFQWRSRTASVTFSSQGGQYEGGEGGEF